MDKVITFRRGQEMNSFLRNGVFSLEKTTCVKNNTGLYACVNPQCSVQNPYICYTAECECLTRHKYCQRMRFKVLLKQVEHKLSPSCELQNRVHTLFDGLIEQIVGARDLLLQRIKKGEADGLFELSDIEYLKEGTQMSGKLLSRVRDTCGRSENREQIENCTEKIEQMINKFKSEEFTSLTDKINALLSSNIKYTKSQNKIDAILSQKKKATTSWSKQLIAKGLVVEGRSVKRVQDTCSYGFILLSTPINQMIGQTIKWRIKIVNFMGYIFLGIGLKTVLQNNNFNIKNWDYDNHGCYIVAYNNWPMTYMDKQQNQRIIEGFGFGAGDIVRLQLNKKTWMLKLINQTTNKSRELKIKHQPLPQEDQYHICALFRDVGSEIELLPDIETDQMLYEVK